jgi:hypothetical protein
MGGLANSLMELTITKAVLLLKQHINCPQVTKTKKIQFHPVPCVTSFQWLCFRLVKTSFQGYMFQIKTSIFKEFVISILVSTLF